MQFIIFYYMCSTRLRWSERAILCTKYLITFYYIDNYIFYYVVNLILLYSPLYFNIYAAQHPPEIKPAGAGYIQCRTPSPFTAKNDTVVSRRVSKPVRTSEKSALYSIPYIK